MAALARLRLHEELGRDGGTIAGLSRTRKEWPVHSVAFLRLRPRRHVRILDAVRAATKRAAKPSARRRIPAESRIITPSAERPMCAYRSEANGRDAPVNIRTIPSPAPAAVTIQPADRTRIKGGIKSAVRRQPATTCPSTRPRYGIVADGNA